MNNDELKEKQAAEWAAYQALLNENCKWNQIVPAFGPYLREKAIPCQCPYSPLGKTSILRIDRGMLIHTFFKPQNGRRFDKLTFCEEQFVKDRGHRSLYIPRVLLSPDEIHSSMEGYLYISRTAKNESMIVCIKKIGREPYQILGTAYPVFHDDPSQLSSHRTKLQSNLRIWTREKGPLKK